MYRVVIVNDRDMVEHIVVNTLEKATREVEFYRDKWYVKTVYYVKE